MYGQAEHSKQLLIFLACDASFVWVLLHLSLTFLCCTLSTEVACD